jgi:hypothetical protein
LFIFLDFWNDGIVLVVMVPDLHQLDHILDAVTDGAFVQHGTEPLEDNGIRFRWVFLEERVFDRVVGGPFKQQDENLEATWRWATKVVVELRTICPKRPLVN